MSFILRDSTVNDVDDIMRLIKELAIFEKAEDKVTVTREEIINDGFGKLPMFKVIVAESSGGDLVGLCFYYVKYSTWRGKGYYLDDLVVTESYRNKGVGSSLLKELVRRANQYGMHFVQWQVLDWNVDAMRFYKRMGASLDAEWVNCMIESKDFGKSI
jgi:GNAT superfamily N-acetyltransferase